jgi:hypothetical protein
MTSLRTVPLVMPSKPCFQPSMTRISETGQVRGQGWPLSMEESNLLPSAVQPV